MTPVHGSSIAEAQVLHDARESNAANLKSEVNVVIHETEGVNPVAESLDPFSQQEIKARPILVVNEDGLAGIATQDHMVYRAWIMDAGFSRHMVIICDIINSICQA
jgi:hypothetical protein